MKIVIAIAALLLIAAVFGDPVNGSSQQQAGPDHRLQVVSLTCSLAHTRPMANLTVRNIGQTELRYAKATIEFSSGVNDGYLDPITLRPGGTATMTTYSPALTGEQGCKLLSIQDRDGYPVAF